MRRTGWNGCFFLKRCGLSVTAQGRVDVGLRLCALLYGCDYATLSRSEEGAAFG